MNSLPLYMRKRKQAGFTLLEVMVALIITGLALGGLFGIIAGNKQLAWRAEDALLRSIQVRALINSSQLNSGFADIIFENENDDFTLSAGEEFETPERKTEASRFTLRKYEILDVDGELITEGSYWLKLELAE